MYTYDGIDFFLQLCMNLMSHSYRLFLATALFNFPAKLKAIALLVNCSYMVYFK